MPGLAIIINRKPAAANLEDLRSMVSSMQHESFYSSGEYSNEALGLYIGWTCHQGSYCDGMPIISNDARHLLFFYGEHVPIAGSNGSQPAANALEVMKLYEQYGDDFLKKLNGWFHGALVDLDRKEIRVFTDRYGMQRLYYHQEEDGYLFASEAKSLLRVKKKLREFDPGALGELFSAGCVLANRSLFKGIVVTPRGSALRFREGRFLETKMYFTPDEWENQSTLPTEEFLQAARDLLPRIMRRYFRSEQPIGISLTGGFDTRVIMAYLNEGQGELPCYTFAGSYRECFDVKIARKIAAECRRRYQVLKLDPDFFRNFASLAEKTVSYSDGNLGAFNAYELYLNQRARQIAPIRLTGSFGSEVIRGARAFKATPPPPGLLAPELEREAQAAVETFHSVTARNGISFSVFNQAPWQYYNRLAIEQTQLTIRTPFMDNELVGLMYRAPKELPRQPFYLDLIAHGDPRLTRFPTDTRNASPLRTWWMQTLFKADYCYKSGMPQWLEKLHYIMGPFQPERLLVGIQRLAHPRVWIRNELADYMKEILLDEKTLSRPFFQRRVLENKVRSHLKGSENHTDDLERALTLELASRLFIDP